MHNTFRTTFSIEPAENYITHKMTGLLMGSCFTEYIGTYLSRYKFPVIINPTGILFNPISICRSLELLLEHKTFTAGDLFQHNNLWSSYSHHGSFSHPDQEKCLQNINSELTKGAAILKDLSYLVLTFGTSWVYKNLDHHMIVANCHKVPFNEFERFRLDEKKIVSSLETVIVKLKKINPTLQVILTVSPVRHLKDGVSENQLSKAILLKSVHKLCEKQKGVTYFPSYEIMMDDLRDYRFYEEDMVHPNAMAIRYIWKKFEETYLNKKSREVIKEVEKIVSAAEHRPLHKDTPECYTFANNQLVKICKLEEKHPFLDFSQERIHFTQLCQSKP